MNSGHAFDIWRYMKRGTCNYLTNRSLLGSESKQWPPPLPTRGPPGRARRPCGCRGRSTGASSWARPPAPAAVRGSRPPCSRALPAPLGRPSPRRWALPGTRGAPRRSRTRWAPLSCGCCFEEESNIICCESVRSFGSTKEHRSKKRNKRLRTAKK